MGDGIWEGGLEDGDGFDFHARAFGQGGDGDAGAGRGIGAEGFTVYAVHDLEFGHVHDEHGHFGHIRRLSVKATPCIFPARSVWSRPRVNSFPMM